MKNPILANDELSFMSQHRYKHIYLNILKTGQNYDYSNGRKIDFDYAFKNEEVSFLNSKYQLEDLKDKSEFNTLFNATNWVSSILKSNEKPRGPKGNSVSIIEDVRNGKYGANCYAHAVVLNDVLCALGFKCKYIFCMPIDIHPFDCHVVNLVYCKEKSKWILLDSANNIFFTDLHGNVLDIAELRDCLINDMEIEVNLMDVYNNISPKNKILIKQKIITYMMKNMYRFGCYKNSHKDREARGTSTEFYHLVPISFMKEPCDLTVYHFEKKEKYTEHYMLNPDAFWGKP